MTFPKAAAEATEKVFTSMAKIRGTTAIIGAGIILFVASIGFLAGVAMPDSAADESPSQGETAGGDGAAPGDGPGEKPGDG